MKPPNAPDHRRDEQRGNRLILENYANLHVHLRVLQPQHYLSAGHQEIPSILSDCCLSGQSNERIPATRTAGMNARGAAHKLCATLLKRGSFEDSVQLLQGMKLDRYAAPPFSICLDEHFGGKFFGNVVFQPAYVCGHGQ